MRKCPNCKKAVPVGARRCVHCRSLVADAADVDTMNAVTRMGTGNSSHGGSQSEHADNARNFYDVQDQSMQHRTMIGLGPISTPASRRSSEDLSRNFGQQTIAGMPGISFDSNARQGGGYRMAAASAQTPERGLTHVKSNRNASPWDDFDFDTKPAPVPDTAAAKQSIHHQSNTQNTYTPTNTRQTHKQQEQEEDALAGLPGVSVVPSSLVDEEFDDLTSKLFGDDFVVNTDDDDEEDGLDFDVPTAPAKPIQPPAHAQNAVTTAKPQTPQPPQAQTTAKTAAQNGNNEYHKPLPLKPQALNLYDKLILGFTLLSALILFIWVISALLTTPDPHQEGSNLPAIILAVSNMAASAFCTLYYRSLKSAHIMIALAVLTVALFAAMIAGGADGRVLLLAGMFCQVFSIGTCFLKN